MRQGIVYPLLRTYEPSFASLTAKIPKKYFRIIALHGDMIRVYHHETVDHHDPVRIRYLLPVPVHYDGNTAIIRDAW